MMAMIRLMGLLPDVVSVKVAHQESSLASKHRQNEILARLQICWVESSSTPIQGAERGLAGAISPNAASASI